MDRVGKFRGRRMDNDEKIYGFYIYDHIMDVHFICKVVENLYSISLIERVEVHPDSVGQFTGVIDMNKIEIYERDKVSCNGYISEVKFSDKTGYRIVCDEDNIMGTKRYTNLGNTCKNVLVI